MAGKSPQPKASEKVGSNNLRRLAPPLAFLAALCLMVVCFYDSGYTSLPPTGKRYDIAKANIDTLRQDEKRSAQREPWENLAAEFRAIYDADPGWPNRPAALFRAAESLEELARRSFAKADAKKAIECYEAVAQRHADSRLADDALFRAAKLRAAWLKDDKGALALLERIKSQYPKGDMISEALALEKTLQAAANGRTAPEARQVSNTDGKEPKDDVSPAKASAAAANASGTQPAAAADTSTTQIAKAGAQQPLPQAELLPRYRDAKAKMEALRADKVRSCWRQPWEELTAEFLRIYLSRKDWAISPGALFRAAASQEALSDCSHLADEYRQARDLYLKLAQEFPKSALADDALLRAATIDADHLNQQGEALELLDAIQADLISQDEEANEDARLLAQTPEETNVPGYYRFDLTQVQQKHPEMSSKSALLPFLKETPFYALDLVCDHIPPWFDHQLPAMQMQYRVENKNNSATHVVITHVVCE